MSSSILAIATAEIVFRCKKGRMDCRIAHLLLDAGKSHSVELHRTFFLDAGKSQLTSNHPVFVSFANCINV